MKNRFGNLFTVTSFGESHGNALGVVIDGCPSGVTFDESFLISQLQRRRPGQNELVSARSEADQPEILSGIFSGKTLGTPITIIVRNTNQRSEDYDQIKSQPRPGHGDDVWREKFKHIDHRGGGRSSGRETISRVMAGAVAEMFLQQSVPSYQICAYASSIGPYSCQIENPHRELVDSFATRFPDSSQDSLLQNLLTNAKKEGKSYGGVVTLKASGLPIGLGQPVFHKLKADLAGAMMSIGATIGIEFGAGFASAGAEGSEFHQKNSSVYGGIRGGISTGESIEMRIAFKPTSSVLEVAKKGRHDPCIVPRAIPVVEAMANLVFADHLLWQRCDQLSGG